MSDLETNNKKSNHRSLLQDDTHHNRDDHGGEEGWLISYADLMTLLVGFFIILQSFSNVDQEKFEEVKKSISKKFGGKYEQPNEALAEQLKEALEKTGVGNQVVVKANDLGVEISFLGTVFFETGSANVKAEALSLMDQITPTIKSAAADFEIIIEGHTDDIPLAGGGLFRNNFELSSIRACRVLDYMNSKGFSKNILTAIGYGETKPLVPNSDTNGLPISENQAKNRRVVLKLIKRDQNHL